MVLFLFFTSTIVCNLKPSSHHLPRLALLFAGAVILVYLMNEIKMLLLLDGKRMNSPAEKGTESAENLYETVLKIKTFRMTFHHISRYFVAGSCGNVHASPK